MANLYELTGKYQQLLELEEELDEITFVDTLESIKDAIEDKAVGYAMVINQFKADEQMLKERENKIKQRRSAIQRKIKMMQQTLLEAMELSNVDKVKHPELTVWVQDNPVSLKVEDETKIPLDFFVEQAPKLDTKMLKEALKTQEIEGAELTQSKGVRIR